MFIYRELFGNCVFVNPYLFHLGISMFISIFRNYLLYIIFNVNAAIKKRASYSRKPKEMSDDEWQPKQG